ncbi:hypothetical protein Q8G81_33740, partial [Klebsiella pneumoniae]
ALNVVRPVMEPVDSSKLMDVKYLTSRGFLGVYHANPMLRTYQFGYLDDVHGEQVQLPCPQAFSIMDKNA